MDNICHTLAGAALAEAGLKRTTRFGTAALLLSSNLPDLDVLVFFTDASPIAFRRGWTHGVVAQALLPFALTATLWAIHRLRGGDSRAGPPLRVGWLLLLSCTGVWSHVLLDLLNTYGVRLLAPVDWRWYYGDSVFIIDVWLWLALGSGVWLARRRGRPAAARNALVFAVCYILAMVVSARAARAIVTDVWRQARDVEPRALMVGPVPVTPFRREVIVDAGDHYQRGTFRWLPPSVTFDPEAVPKNAHLADVRRAREQSAEIRAFLVWSRFPHWSIVETSEGTRVTVGDMRFPGRPGPLSDQFTARSLLPPR